MDVQISIDGADEATNDAVRGRGSYASARRAMDHLAAAGFGPFKISVVVTRENVAQLDDLESLASSYGAKVRLTRLRPSGRGADVWHDLHPTQEQQVDLYRWLIERPGVLTGDSFFHLSALGEPLPGLNLCGAGRVVCLIDPVGDVYACPFVLHPEFKAGSVRDAGGFARVWRRSPLFLSLREPASAGACASCGSYDACQGGCMAAKFFTGLPLDGPDPECVKGHGEASWPGLRPVLLLHRVRAIRCRSPFRPAGGSSPAWAGRVESGCRPFPSRIVSSRATGPARLGAGVGAGDPSLLAVPVGSTEQHGPHLPLSTDTDIALGAVRPAGLGAGGRAGGAGGGVRGSR